MVVVLVLITFLVCITIGFVRRHRAENRASSGMPVQSATEVAERYFHPSHSWALVKDRKSVIVGVDDLVPRIMGKVDQIEITPTGTTVRRGEPLVTLHSGSRSLSLGSPLSGVVEETNSGLLTHPSILADSPLEEGWIAKLAPRDLAAEIGDLLNGSRARQWREAVQIHVSSWFSPRLGTVLQDGGQWVDDIGSLVNDEEWRALTQVLFLTGPFQQSKN